ATAELNADGSVKTTEGSWQAGVDGAQPGIVMPGRVRLGAAFRQEYYKGHAEDHFQVVSLAASIDVPFISTRHGMRTREWTPLEPGNVEYKYYVRGTGLAEDGSLQLAAVKR